MLKNLELRRCGVLSPVRFKSQTLCSFGVNLEEAKICITPSTKRNDDMTISQNRLLTINLEGLVSAYDVTPRIYENIGSRSKVVLPVVATWHANTNLTYSTTRYSIEYASSCEYFVTTGAKNMMEIVDGNYFVKKDIYFIRNAKCIYMHSMSPREPNLIAVASSLNTIVLVDQKCGNISYGGKQHLVNPVQTVAWSPYDSNYVLSANPSEVYLWDLRKLNEPIRIKVPLGNHIYPYVSFLSRTTALVLTDVDEMSVWDLVGSSNILKISNFYLSSPYRRHRFFVRHDTNPNLLYVTYNSIVNVINLKNGDILKQIGQFYEGVHTIEYNAASKDLFVMTDFETRVWRPTAYVR